MIEKLKKLISTGNFQEAYKLTDKIKSKDLKDCLFLLGYTKENIATYGFVCFLLFKNENIKYHILASELLNFAFPHLAGAYATSLGHIQRAIEIEPENIDLKAYLLFFNEIPDKLISDEDAKKIAHTIIALRPDNVIANDFLKNFD